METPRVEPGAAGCEARMLSIVLLGPKSVYVCAMTTTLNLTFSPVTVSLWTPMQKKAQRPIL